MRILAVAAHPDDEILGVGGTIAMHVDRGDVVQLAIMCEGISMRYPPERLAEVRQQSMKAAAILGVHDVIIRDLPDQRLDILPLSEIVKEVEALIRGFQPDSVYTQFSGDINRDHRVLAEAVAVAARPFAAPHVAEILMFETPSSTEWGFSQLAPSFQPNVFVDISRTLERKLQAFACYEAEVCPEPHPRSLIALRERAHYWGSHVNRHAAEAFTCLRQIR
jgi:LmbE family N-acetylglucosaminyl deacetylase